VAGFGLRMNRLFFIEADVITNRDFQLIHRYILSKLHPCIIKSIPLNKEMQTYIKGLGV